MRRRLVFFCWLLAAACSEDAASTVVWPDGPELVFTLVFEGANVEIEGPRRLPMTTSLPAEAELFLVGLGNEDVGALHPRAVPASTRLQRRPSEAATCPDGRFGGSSLAVPLVGLAEILRVSADGALSPASPDDRRFDELELEVQLDVASCPIPPDPGVLIADISGHPPLMEEEREELRWVAQLEEDRFVVGSDSNLFLVDRGERGVPRRVFPLSSFADPPVSAWAVTYLQVARYPTGPARIFLAMNRFAGEGRVSESALIELVASGDRLVVAGRRTDLPRLESFFVDPSRGLLVAATQSVLVGTSTSGPLFETPFAHGLGPSFVRFTGDEAAPHLVVGRDWVWRGRLDGSPVQVETLVNNPDSRAVGSPTLTLLTNFAPSTASRIALFYSACRSAVFVDPSSDCAAVSSLADADGEIRGVDRQDGRLYVISITGRILELEEAR